MSDEYTPAIDMPSDSADDSAGADENDTPGAVTASPKENAEPAEPRRQSRVINDKVKAMFRSIAKQHDGELEVGDLVPMAVETKPVAKVPAKTASEVEAEELVPVETEAEAKPAAKVPAPAAPVAAKPDAAMMVERATLEREKLAHADAKAELERERASLAEMKTALAEREKQIPDRTSWIERPGATMMAHLRDLYGTADDGELKDVLTDLVTELSETGLGVKLPAEVKMAMESRKAVRAVKAYKADLTREQQKIAEARTKAEQEAKQAREAADAAANERKAFEQVRGLVSAAAGSFPFLQEQDDPSSIVFEVIKEQVKRGDQVDWKSAAQLAEDYFKAQAEETVKKAERLRPKLNPTPTAPAPAPAKATTTASPGAASGPAAKPQSKPAPATETTAIDEENSQPMDRHERRAAQARALRAKHFPSAGA